MIFCTSNGSMGLKTNELGFRGVLELVGSTDRILLASFGPLVVKCWFRQSATNFGLETKLPFSFLRLLSLYIYSFPIAGKREIGL